MEKENIRLEQDMVRMTDRETDLNNAIISLKENMVIYGKRVGIFDAYAREAQRQYDRCDRSKRTIGLERTLRSRPNTRY